MARGDIPKITWGTSFANTLYLGYPLDSALSFSSPREGIEIIRSPSGEQDVWSLGVNFYLTGTARFIPISNGTTPYGDTITGWDGATGFRAFLDWAKEGNAIRWFPDKDSGTYITSYLDFSPEDRPTLEKDQTFRSYPLIIWNASTAYTGY